MHMYTLCATCMYTSLKYNLQLHLIRHGTVDVVARITEFRVDKQVQYVANTIQWGALLSVLRVCSWDIYNVHSPTLASVHVSLTTVEQMLTPTQASL